MRVGELQLHGCFRISQMGYVTYCMHNANFNKNVFNNKSLSPHWQYIFSDFQLTAVDGGFD